MYAMCLGGIFVADQTVQRALEKQHVKSLPRFQKLGSVPKVAATRDKNPRGTEFVEWLKSSSPAELDLLDLI
jgi:hypothetical protein